MKMVRLKSGLLYFDATKERWSYVDVNGFNLIGRFDPTNADSINKVLSSEPNPGDFFVLKQSGSASGILNDDVVAFNEGDWIVWDGENWRKIDYRGKVVSIYSSQDVIVASGGRYNWDQVVIKPNELNPGEKTQSKISDISDVGSVQSASDPKCCLLRWNGSSWEASLDISESTAVSGAQVSGLTDKHFSSGLNKSKISGLTNRLNNKVSKSAPGEMSGAIVFSGASSEATFINVNKISNDADQILLSELGAKLDELYNSLSGEKQPFIAPNGGAEYIAGNLEFKSRSSDQINDPNAQYFMSDAKVLGTTLQASDLDAKDSTGVDLSGQSQSDNSTSLGEGIDLLVYQVNNRFSGNGQIEGESLKSQALEPRHLKSEGATPGDYLYFDGSNWTLTQHTSSLKFIGLISDGGTPTATPAEGDYYIASESVTGFNSSSLNLNKGDWVMFVQGEWIKVTNASPVTSFNLGSDSSGAGAFIPKVGDYRLDQIEMSNSKLTDLSDVEGSPVLGKVLRWNGESWEVADDLVGASQIDGGDIPGSVKFSRSYYQPAEGDEKLDLSQVTNFPQGYLKKESSSQALSGVADMGGNAITGVEFINGISLEEQKQNYQNFISEVQDIELKSDVMDLANSASPDSSKFFISSGSDPQTNAKNREFDELSLDDVSLEGTNYDFYTSEKVYNSTLDGYDASSVDDSELTISDTPLSAIRKLENQVNNGGATVATKLYEDNTFSDAPGGVYQSKYAVDSSNNNDVFVSSYSIFSLPDPDTISSGFRVTFKSENGPVFIYPSYDSSNVSDPPKIEGRHNYFILTEKDAFARVTFESGQWWITDSDKISYSILKDDRPIYCPVGMIAVAGSYLLETDGFCIEQEQNYVTAEAGKNTGRYLDVSGSITTTDRLNQLSENCRELRDVADGGYSDIASMGQILTVFQNAIQYDSTNFFTKLRDEQIEGCKNSVGVTVGTPVEINNFDYFILNKHRYYSTNSSCVGTNGIREITSLNIDPSSLLREVIISEEIVMIQSTLQH